MAVDVGSATGYLDLDISGFLAGLRSAQSEADTASKNIATKIGNNITGIGKSMTSVGSTLTKSVTVPLLGIGTAGLKVASDFDSAFSQFQAKVGDATGSMDEYKSVMDEVYKNNYGDSVMDIADAMGEVVARLGEMDSSQLQKTTESAIALRDTFGYEVPESLRTVDTLMKNFGLTADQAFDYIVKGQQEGLDFSGEFLDTINEYSVQFRKLGLDANDMFNILKTGADSGAWNLDKVGDAIKEFSIRVIDGSDATQHALKTLGYDFEDTMETFAQGGDGARDVFFELITQLSYMDDEVEKNTVGVELFGTMWEDLGPEVIKQLSDMQIEAINTKGAMDTLKEVKYDNLESALGGLLRSLQSAGASLGQYLIPKVEAAIDVVDGLVEKFDALDPSTKELIVNIGLAAAAIGPVLLVLGKLTSSIGSIITTFGKIPGAIAKAKSAFTAVSAAIGGISAPVVAVVAVIGVLIVTFVNLWKTNEEFRNKMTAIWNQIKGTFDKLCQGIVDRLNKLGFDFENIGEVLSAIWKGFCDLLAPYFEGVFQYIADTFDTIVNVILGILDFFIAIFTGDWEGAWDAIKGIFESVWNGIVAWFQNIGNTLLGMLDVVLGWFGTTWDETWTNIKQFFVDIWNGITSFFSNVINSIKMAVSNFITTIINFFAQLPTNIANFITNAYNSVVTWVSNMVAKAREMGQNFLNAVVSFFTNLPYKVGYFIGSTLTNIVIWVGNMVTKAREMGTNFINTVVSFFTQLPGKILQFITSAFNNVQIWATNMVNKAREMGTNFINNVVSFFTQLPGKVLQFITSAFNNVQIWATNMANKARETGTNFINNVVSFMQQLPGKIKQYLDSAINNLKTWVTQMGQKGKEAVQSLINNVMSAASGIASKVMSIGSDIVSGVWNGIKGAAGWFKDQVEGFFSGIVDGVKDALGIGSPSKVFRDEIGRWLPPGVVQGFEAAMPSAMKTIQKVMNKGIDGIDTDDISVGAGITVSGFADKLKSIYNEVALWFESIESRIGNSVDSMMQSLDMLIRAGQVIVNSDGTLGYIGYNGFTRIPTSNDDNRYGGNDRNDRGGGDTFIFNSPKAIDEIEAARQMKQTKRDIAEGF